MGHSDDSKQYGSKGLISVMSLWRASSYGSVRACKVLFCLWHIGPIIFLFMAYSPLYFSVYGI